MNEFKPKVALIMRNDEMIEEFNLKRVTIDTSFGPVDRCFEGYVYDVPVLVIYGRFNGQKVPSNEINFEQTIEAIKNRGISKVIGTFVVGGINPEMPQGSVYVLGDLIGMSGYNIHWNRNISFHNAEMYEPFCPNLTKKLCEAAGKMEFPVKTNATYVTFYGYPRIETKGELKFYNKMGWDVVGQTCDPEATLAKLNQMCYAAVAVQIDDPNSRNEYIDGLEKNEQKKQYVESIKSCRERTTKIVLQYLKDFKDDDCPICKKMSRKNNNFREFPDKFYE